MKKYINSILLVTLVSTLMVGCGDYGTTTTPPVSYKGVFVDAVVGGITWECGISKGVTGADGIFGPCKTNDPVSFSLGTIKLGTITDTSVFKDPKSTVITPAALEKASGKADVATKIAVLLQSLDSDGDTSNGISIDSKTVEIITKNYKDGLDLADTKVKITDVETVTVQTVAEVVSTTSNVSMKVVNKEAAVVHLENTQKDIDSGKIKAPKQPDKVITTGGTGAN